MQKSNFGRTPAKARASSSIEKPTKAQRDDRAQRNDRAQRDVGTPPSDRLTLISFYVMMAALAAALVYLVALLIFV